jgi:hypothetical protein
MSKDQEREVGVALFMDIAARNGVTPPSDTDYHIDQVLAGNAVDPANIRIAEDRAMQSSFHGENGGNVIYPLIPFDESMDTVDAEVLNAQADKAEAAYNHFAPGVQPTRKVDLKLYQFPAEYEALGEFLEESEGEITPEIQELLDNLKGDLETKVDNIVRLIRQKNLFAQARWDQSTAHLNAGNVYRKAGIKLEEYLANVLYALGKYEIETPSAHVVLNDNPVTDNPTVWLSPSPQCQDIQDSCPAPYSAESEIGWCVDQINQRTMLMEARKAEAKRLSELAAEDEKLIGELKQGIMDTLRGHGTTKLETGTWKVRIQRNGLPSIAVQDTEDLSALMELGYAYQPDPVIPPVAIDTKKVREDWKAAGSPEVWVPWSGEPTEYFGLTSVPLKTPRLEVKLGSHLRLK